MMGAMVTDRIRDVRLSAIALPLGAPISDAKVLTGRQRPMTEVAILVAEVRTEQGLKGMGFSYSKRGGGAAQYAHAVEVGREVIGEDPNDIPRIYEKLLWAGASVGRSGAATQALAAIDIALYDLKARRAGLPLAKLLGGYRDSVRVYNTSGGFLHSSVSEICDRADASLAEGISGIKVKVGQPDRAEDLRRVTAIRQHLGADVPLMADANQQWDRATALRMGRALDEFDLAWIEEPLDAHDAEGHADLTRRLDTPIATGEMLTSVLEHERLIDASACDIIQPDAPRVGGITPFLGITASAAKAGLTLAPHFAMQIHLHLAATYPTEPWLEHFEWLDPLFDERYELREGRMLVPDRPGLGLSLSENARNWTTDTVLIDARAVR